MGLVIAFVLLVAGVYLYAKKNHAYVDRKYGFILLNQSGWYSVPKKDGIYYLVGTKEENSNTVVSTFSISPVATLSKIDNARKLAFVTKFCKETFTQPDFSTVTVEETLVRHIPTVVCMTENIPTHVNKLYITKAYIMFNNKGGKYDYIITVTYPKDSQAEQSKVNRILNSFSLNFLQ